MTVTALARKKPDPSERAALREAIAVAVAARQKVSATEAAVERAEELVIASKARLEAAVAAVVTAQAEDAKALAAAIASGGSSSARATRQARAVETEAADFLESARHAAASLKVDLEDLVAAAARADKAVDSALAETLRPAALVLLKEARACHLRFLRMCEALSVMSRSFNPWDDEDQIAKQIGRVGSPSDDDVRASVVSRKQWESAIAALREDADALLPEQH